MAPGLVAPTAPRFHPKVHVVPEPPVAAASWGWPLTYQATVWAALFVVAVKFSVVPVVSSFDGRMSGLGTMPGHRRRRRHPG